jgi:hypothetical protein
MGGITAPEFNSHTKEAWGKLNKDFKVIVDKNLVDAVLEEKAMAVGIWNEIERLSKSITSGDDKFKDYLRVSSSYGRIKYEIIQQAWIIMLKAMESEKTRIYEKAAILDAKVKYDQLWNDFKYSKANNQQCATLYQPYSFDLNYETFHGEEGMDKAVNGFVAYIKDK